MLVLDHLGLTQPFEPPPPKEPWAELPTVLKLAAHKNITIKISGACTLSHQPYPYRDIWDPLRRIFDAFGLDRCLWGTDWTRAVALLTYKEGVDAFRVTDRLSDGDRATLMGETLSRVYNWSPAKPGAAARSGGLTQHGLLQFGVRVARQRLGDELDRLRHLVVGHALGAEGAERLRGDARIARPDERLHALAQDRVGPPDHR